MIHNKKELDVDFIGEQKPITKKEEKVISEYLKAKRVRKINRLKLEDSVTQRSYKNS